MTTFLVASVVIHGLELLLWTPPLWSVRRYLVWVPLLLTVVTAALVLITSFSFLAVLLTILSVYRLVNLTRIAAGRIKPEYLKRSTWRTTLWLLGFEIAILLLWWALHSVNIWGAHFWYVFMGLQLTLAIVLLVTTLRHWRSMRPSLVDDRVINKELPTLTVAIPARNESEDLQMLLSSLTTSTYPKLEILVLDDCSTLKRTPEIIRSFAHDGVRFIKGKEPEDGWLAKNQAYQRLLEEANGDLVLFCGADVRFEPDTLTSLVNLMLFKKKNMMSIMPRNILPRFLQLDASLIQPMRYAWEIALPRKMFRRPPVLSTCWIAKRDVLLSAGGFSAVSRSVVPESYFARVCVRHDGYSFRYSTDALGLTSHKALSDQRDTATRTKYPQVHRRIEFVTLLSVAELFGMVMPFFFFIVGLLLPPLHVVQVVSGITCFLLLSWYMMVCVMTYRKPDLRSLLSLPFAVLLDVALLNYSMLKYEFSVVLWKDRNVCIPVMRVEAGLPKE